MVENTRSGAAGYGQVREGMDVPDQNGGPGGPCSGGHPRKLGREDAPVCSAAHGLS
jgi:hypothetical protein